MLLYWLFSEPHLYCLLVLETGYGAPVNHFYVGAENSKAMQFQKFVVFEQNIWEMKTLGMCAV